MTSEPKVCKRTVSCLSVDIKSKAGEFLNDFTRMSTDVNTKRKAPAEEIAARTKAASASAIDLMIADHNIISQAEKHEKALRQLNQVLDKAQKDCQEMVQGNKRLKLDVKSTRDKDNEFRAANNTLTCENQKLRTNLEAEKKQNANLREVLDRVSEEARKEFATQLQQEKTKAVKAEAEREQETKVAKDLRKQLDTMTAQLEKKDVKAASQVVKEKKRADEAEAKLATIQAVFGRTI
ncbi:hypothetical protein SLS60_008389 [Paraconiothyrium brasiliense]|uniref:Uncharacterized protein n=1 Tax=Paraconiothyrium brasiliense TaxID=300254 RepID=A0ABR3R0G2_9PLEO